jgi:hypothetical protein
MSPRLRHLKNYNFDFEKEEEKSEGLTGQSWLSNATIIQSLNDDKIRTAIKYHRETAKLLENELICRANGIRTYHEFTLPSFRTNRHNIIKVNNESKVARKLRRILQQARVKPEMVEDLVKVWLNILKEPTA